jgi:hypothetical protein
MARGISKRILDVGNNYSHNYRTWDKFPLTDDREE